MVSKAFLMNPVSVSHCCVINHPIQPSGFRMLKAAMTAILYAHESVIWAEFTLAVLQLVSSGIASVTATIWRPG